MTFTEIENVGHISTEIICNLTVYYKINLPLVDTTSVWFKIKLSIGIMREEDFETCIWHESD